MSVTSISSAKDIGDIVSALRKRQGIRQADMAGMIGASHVLLRDIERGKETVNIGKVLLLLEELGIRVLLDVPEA
ncbi:helix-turn-helix domain-containing protein [Geopseudomonas aromaticivorans]